MHNGNLSRFVVCIDNTGNEASLDRHKLYELLPDEAAAARGFVRVVDESGEDYLFPAAMFLPVPVPATLEQALLQAAS